MNYNLAFALSLPQLNKKRAALIGCANAEDCSLNSGPFTVFLIEITLPISIHFFWSLLSLHTNTHRIFYLECEAIVNKFYSLRFCSTWTFFSQYYWIKVNSKQWICVDIPFLSPHALYQVKNSQSLFCVTSTDTAGDGHCHLKLRLSFEITI